MNPNREVAAVRRPFFTTGTWMLLALILTGYSFGLARLLTGLGGVTGLSQSYPWGIWKAFNVAVGVALASSGFTGAALIDIFGRKRYKGLLRSAILTAWLGYLMVVVSLLFDLGRYWNIWQPIFNWQGNSVLFEVAMCVMAYLIVLTLEMSPALIEGLRNWMAGPRRINRWFSGFARPLEVLYGWIKIVLPLFIIAGFVLSCMHHSSLGTLMLIAPTKLSPLWFTPLLPVLFLLSSFMIGFPLIILADLLASRTFGYSPDIRLLGSLARNVPWFIGVYLLTKVGDLIVRWPALDFMAAPSLTLSLVIEILAGLILPLTMLCFRRVRKSPPLLLAAVMLLIAGVVLNRLNVYLVGFTSPFASQHYSPSIGELAMSLAIVGTVLFLYRFFVTFFPVLPSYQNDASPSEASFQDYSAKAWIVRGVGAASLLVFVILYAFVHERALSEVGFTAPPLQRLESRVEVFDSSQSLPHADRPLEYRNLYLLNDPALNAQINDYEPVRFSHRTHDVNSFSDCSTCHHRVSMGEEDRHGENIREMHRSIEVRIGGACGQCHGDLKDKPFNKCSFCHSRYDPKTTPSRIGLKAAYHRQCIGCHQRQPREANAPTDCKGCHHPLVPRHADLVKVEADMSAPQVTRVCLACHEQTGRDVMNSSHWSWQGLTPHIVGHEHRVDTGLMKVVDNYTLSMRPELVDSYALHAGYKRGEAVDCLVCHDTTQSYRKEAGREGEPAADVDLVRVAEEVGRPSVGNCGRCHYTMGGGPNFKHGDLEPLEHLGQETVDVHMQRLKMPCQACHATERHQIRGISFMAPFTVGGISCAQCHGSAPHGISGYLSRHLDDHVRAISCETCHIPFLAQTLPTLLATDFSRAGEERSEEVDRLGMPRYDRRRGEMQWGKRVVPEYRWYDGNRRAYVLGDPVEPGAEFELNAPLGGKHIPESRIFPFKVHRAVQPYDTERKVLVVAQFVNGFWTHFDWKRAIEAGMREVGQPFSGEYGFMRTAMYTSVRHGVIPALKALGCADCHRPQAVSCSRCHRGDETLMAIDHARMVYPDVPNRMDFRALGYADDPAAIGGRFSIIPKGRPNR